MSEPWPTAADVSQWFRRSGTLPRGEVSNLRVELTHTTDFSKLVFLTATYSSNATADLPPHIVVKSSLETANADYLATESKFYNEIAPVVGTPPVVRCLATIESEGNCPGTIVLEDLRGSHDHPPWPLNPSKKECELAIDALARLHTQCWEVTKLGESLGPSHTAESLTAMVKGIAAHLPAFVDANRDVLTDAERKVYDSVFSSSLKPWMRLTDRHALTIIHGDAHTWNFLFPRSGLGDTYLIDWQLWHVDIGARDLAFFMALHWSPDRRGELETQLLRRYYEALLRSGIANYSYDDLWLDYRRCVVRNLTIPILFWSRGMKREGWKHRLECALAAYEDLHCDELL